MTSSAKVRVLKPGERPSALRAGNMKQIHISGKAVAACAAGDPQPCVTIRTMYGDFHCSDCEWDGPTKLVERIQEPLPDGTRIWIETYAEVMVIR